TFLACTGELGRLREARAWLGLPAAILPAMGWLWASSRGTGFDPMQVVRRQVFERFQAGIHHPRPFYYYLISLPLEFLPWTPFLAGSLVITFPSRDRPRRKTLLFLYSWILAD